MRRTTDERGVAFVLELVLVAVALGAIGFAIYISVHSRHTTKPSVTPSPSISKSTSSPTPSPASNYLIIKELGIKFALNDEFKDLLYSYSTPNGLTVLRFSTQSLVDADNTCTADAAPLASIVVLDHPSTNPGSRDSQDGTFVAQAGRYYLYYSHPQYICGVTSVANNISLQQTKDILPVLQTATAAN